MNTPNSPLKKALDAAAISAFAAMCVSGLILRNALPASALDAGMTASPLMPRWLGLSNGDWASLNNAALTLLLFLLLPNIFWGWGCIAKIVGKGNGEGSGTRAAVGIVALITLIAGCFTGFSMSGPAGFVAPPPNVVPILGQGSDDAIVSLSLDEADRRLGIPMEFLRSRLHLPANVSTTAKMSTLMEAYKFTPEDVRRAVIEHRSTLQLDIPEPPTN